MTVNSQEPRWLVRARRQVPARTQARGARLLLEGQVRDLSGDASSASATVGPEQCRVALRYDAETALLVVGCDCAEYLQGDDCRHIVAAMLAAAQRGLLSQASGARDLLLMPEHEGDLFGDEEFLEAPVPRPGPVPGAAAPPGRPPAPAWQAPFELVRHALHVEPAEIRTWAGREIVYLLDLPAWRSGGTLPVAVGHRERKRNGDWSKFKPQAPPARIIPELPDPADRQLLSALLGAHAAALYPYDGYRAYGSGPGLFHLPLTGQRELLRTMCETGRCLARLAPGPQAEPVRLRWDEGPAWELCLDIGPAPKGPGLRLTGSLRRGEQRIPLSEPALLTAGGVVILRDAAAPFEDYGAYPWVPLLRQQGAIAIPAGQEAAAAAALLTLPKSPRLDLPEAMRYEPVRLPPRPRLTIRSARRGYGTQARLEADLVFEYDGRPVPDGETARGVVDVPGRRFLLRDPAAEQDAERLLRSLGFRRIGQGYATRPGLQLAPRHLAAAVPALLAAGWRVEAEGKLYRPAGHLHVEVTTGIDWFELAGAARFDDQEVALPRLLAALRKGEKTVLLDDGTLGLLPEEWLERYGLLAGLGEVARGVLRFGKSQAMLLDALLASRPEVRFDEAFAGAREALLRFERVEAAEAPAGFTGTLRPYQREGLGWLDFLRAFGFGGCLADDMGLGKTVQVLAMLAGRREATGGRPSLIVVPRSLVFNWKHEAARFAPGLRILDHTGAGRLRESASHFRDYDVVLTTYGTLRRDVAGLADTRFDYLILDEAQAVKNAGTQSAKAVRLLQGDHRLALSGTPVENHLGELWSLFEFLNPGMLGGAAVFKLFAGQNGRALSAEGRQVLGRALRPFILRRTKEQVAADLPPKMEQTIVCDMPAEQRSLYDELREHYRRSLLPMVDRQGMQRAQFQVLEALLRLRQAACHAALLDPARVREPSGKFDVLLPQLDEVREAGHKALVFSQFTSLLALLRRHLDAQRQTYEYLDGRTRDRAARVERFQGDPDCRLFLISLKAGGLGLNLTAADYVFLLDPWWNPAVEAQAIDRTHRIGQTRQVFAYRLIARDSVEEKVLQLQESKRELADAILQAGTGGLHHLRREDLELLLS